MDRSLFERPQHNLTILSIGGPTYSEKPDWGPSIAYIPT